MVGKGCSSSQGFTLPEVLVSAVVLVVAVVGSIAAFNLVTQSVRGTGVRADQARRIDADIAEITQISEVYTACETPEGSVPVPIPEPGDDFSAACGADVEVGNSFYYIPDSSVDQNDLNDFFAACRSNAQAGHITANFITAVNALPPPGGDVTRQNAERVDGNDAANHLVRINWVNPTRNDRVLRSIEIAPTVTAWCP